MLFFNFVPDISVLFCAISAWPLEYLRVEYKVHREGNTTMNDIQVLSMTRNIISTALQECTRQEFNAPYILKQYRTKLSNLMTSIQADKAKNRKVQARQINIVQNACIYNTITKFDILYAALNVKKSLLPSAMDVLQKSKK